MAKSKVKADAWASGGHDNEIVVNFFDALGFDISIYLSRKEAKNLKRALSEELKVSNKESK